MNTPYRRFNLVDAMVLVAATALAAAVIVPGIQEESHFLRLEFDIPAGRCRETHSLMWVCLFILLSHAWQPAALLCWCSGCAGPGCLCVA
jgi:hypothetical protein